MADGHLRRVMIFMPPRFGKSELASRLFPAYWLYRNPRQWVGINSYGAELAYTLSRAARENYQRSGGSVKDDAAAVKHWETSEGGGLWAAGVGGPILGKGWHLGIIDDPCKNATEAFSPAIQETQREWYDSTFYTREEPNIETGEPDGALVIINQRWSDQDLCGWLLSQEVNEDEEDSPERWHVVSFEAIKEEDEPELPATCTLEPDWRAPGESLCPERRPIAKLKKIRARTASYFWNALFQQRPSPRDGGLFKRGWFRPWRVEGDDLYRLVNPQDGSSKLVKAADCRRFGIIDLAFSTKKEADFTVLTAWAVSPESDLILLDLDRRKMEAPELVPAMEAMGAAKELPYWGMEANGAQLGIVQGARKKGIAVRALKADVDKVSRSLTAQVRMEAGQIYFPERAPWLDDLKAELLGFPKSAHDDCTDNLSYAAIEVFGRRSMEVY